MSTIRDLEFPSLADIIGNQNMSNPKTKIILKNCSHCLYLTPTSQKGDPICQTCRAQIMLNKKEKKKNDEFNRRKKEYLSQFQPGSDASVIASFKTGGRKKEKKIKRENLKKQKDVVKRKRKSKKQRKKKEIEPKK